MGGWSQVLERLRAVGNLGRVARGAPLPHGAARIGAVQMKQMHIEVHSRTYSWFRTAACTCVAPLACECAKWLHELMEIIEARKCVKRVISFA